MLCPLILSLLAVTLRRNVIFLTFFNYFFPCFNNYFAELQELLPGIINQLGPDALTNLKKLADSFAKAGLNAEGDVPNLAEDDAVPDLAEAPAAAEPAATETTA